MPYAVGSKGSNGCSGYPVVKEGGEVMGCHMTQEAATRQVQALYAAESDKADGPNSVNPSSTANPKYPNVGVKTPTSMRGGKKVKLRRPRMQGGNGADASGAFSSGGTSISAVYKAYGEIMEGCYVMGMTTEGMVHGMVEHIMTEGGVYGVPGTEYAIQSMPPENPAMAVRIYEEDEDEPGTWEPTAYSIGMMYKDAIYLETLEGHTMEGDEEEYEDEDEMEKAEGYSPTAGMKAAAARAIRWKEEGKATGAGTPVGWGRARDIVAGRSMSLSVVKRMYSFFARHEVDKKGKDFYNTSNPSNGRIMWDAWGGDPGFTWSKAIATREADKALFADFGKDYSDQGQRVSKAVGVGSMVSWNSSGGTATGKIVRIIRNGKYNVPNSDFTVTGTPEDPAAVIRIYRDGKPTETLVGHKVKTLRSK
jgi:hypothetical protein